MPPSLQLHNSPPLLHNVSVLNVGLNLPAPRAAKLLAEMGATIVKIEPPTGDPFEKISPEWYADLHSGVHVHKIHVKTPAGRRKLHQLLAEADILFTSQRPAALTRMGLEPIQTHRRYPHLAIVNIVGDRGEGAKIPGHDLTYQTKVGLVTPPSLPRTLIADLAGAQMAVIAALALYASGGGVREVALSDAAAMFGEPLQFGLTQKGHFLGGGHAGYNIYATKDGFIALAALETKFWQRMRENFPDLPQNPLAPTAFSILKATFRTEPTKHWRQWARLQDIPLEPVNASDESQSI